MKGPETSRVGHGGICPQGTPRSWPCSLHPSLNQLPSPLLFHVHPLRAMGGVARAQTLTLDPTPAPCLPALPVGSGWSWRTG